MKSRSRCVVVALALLVSVGASAPGPGAAAAAGQADGWHLDIDRAIEAIGLTAGMVVGEAGAGEGYFTFPMARRVGADGLVLANDISTRALSSLDRRRASEQIANIQTVAGTVDDPRFPRHDLQMIVVVHAFHDFSSPVEWLVNAKKYLRPGATLAIIDRKIRPRVPKHTSGPGNGSSATPARPASCSSRRSTSARPIWSSCSRRQHTP